MALEFKSATLHAVRLVLHQADTPALLTALDQRMRDAGSFFQHEPMLIDALTLDAVVDWPILLAGLQQHQLLPIGVIAQGANLDAARAAGLSAIEPGAAPARTWKAPAQENYPVGDTASVLPDGAEHSVIPAPTAMVVQRQLRSGQRLYARGTDLVVIGLVSQGAEVIADGNVHIYGALRGKAMAGARGDTSARIFALQLDPELLAIAGVYRVIETRLDADQHNRACLVQLEGETLAIQAL